MESLVRAKHHLPEQLLWQYQDIGLLRQVMPSFRQACEFDFFRGQPGSIFRPDIFDDGTLSGQQFKKLKAFTDVGNVESMSKERWGAAKWMKGHILCQ